MLTTDIRKFWRVINPSSDSSITLKDESGEFIPNEACANILCESFANNFSTSSHIDQPHTEHYNYLIMQPIALDFAGIARLIDDLPLNSAPGYDTINSKF